MFAQCRLQQVGIVTEESARSCAQFAISPDTVSDCAFVGNDNAHVIGLCGHCMCALMVQWCARTARITCSNWTRRTRASLLTDTYNWVMIKTSGTCKHDYGLCDRSGCETRVSLQTAKTAHHFSATKRADSAGWANTGPTGAQTTDMISFG